MPGLWSRGSVDTINTMAESKERNYREIEILEDRLAKLKEALGKPESDVPPDKELLRDVITERIREAIPIPPIPVPSVPPAQQSIQKQARDELEKVEQFVTLAFSRDIPFAVKSALKSGNAYLIDAFHDTLVDRFYEELVKSGKLK